MKKGQAAMEFLMTYGWAILVVIAAIAALAYFGVLDPARLLPERCQFPSGIDCIDKASISTTALTIALRNNQGYPISIDSATVNNYPACGAAEVYIGTSTTSNGTVATDTLIIPNNEVFRVEFGGCGLNSGDKFDSDIDVGYTNQESLLANHAVGAVRGRVA